MLIKFDLFNNDVNKEKIIITTLNKTNNNKIIKNNTKIKTAKGDVNFDEIMKNAYNPYGFNVEILSYDDIIPKIRFKKNQTCFQVNFNLKNNYFL
jgi:hypothetical protein